MQSTKEGFFKIYFEPLNPHIYALRIWRGESEMMEMFAQSRGRAVPKQFIYVQPKTAILGCLFARLLLLLPAHQINFPFRQKLTPDIFGKFQEFFILCHSSRIYYILKTCSTYFVLQKCIFVKIFELSEILLFDLLVCKQKEL